MIRPPRHLRKWRRHFHRRRKQYTKNLKPVFLLYVENTNLSKGNNERTLAGARSGAQSFYEWCPISLRRALIEPENDQKTWLSVHKNIRFHWEIDQKVYIFVEKLKKMQPTKITFRSQLEPSIKSYECFMFLLNFRLEMTLDWWILERP